MLSFTHRLWFKLAVSYTVLGFCAMLTLTITLYGINDFNDFKRTYTEKNLRTKVETQLPLIYQGLTVDKKWLKMAEERINDLAVNLESTDGQSYKIKNSSRPIAFIRIKDASGRVLSTYPHDRRALLCKPDHCYSDNSDILEVNMNILDSGGQVIGSVIVALEASFDLAVQLETILHFVVFTWLYILLLSLPIGIICGLQAARYLGAQLGEMNTVVESWRNGNFERKIGLQNDDVLTRHGGHLNAMAKDLKGYMNLKLQQTASEERNRVARELHDTVKQNLFALGLQMAAAKNANALNETHGFIAEALEINREAQKSLVQIIHQLQPSKDIHNLKPVIEQLSNILARRLNIHIDTSLLSDVWCEAYIIENIKLIIQESVMNVYKHAEALNIRVKLNPVGRFVKLEIVDDGRGFYLDKSVKGVGLASMRARASALPDSYYHINSKVGTGTKIYVLWRVRP